jgi:hypothetical protein
MPDMPGMVTGMIRTAIMVNQDPSCQGERIESSGNKEIWAKPLSEGRVAVLLINRSEKRTADFSVPLDNLGLKGTAAAREIFGDRYLGTFKNTMHRKVKPGKGCFILIEPFAPGKN